jgi:probable O-glycosylation ligase (exosortase A-associated)
MRDVLVSLIVLGSLPVSFRKPFVGLLMFSILAYMRLQDLAWGFARFQRWSFFVAIVMVAGYVVQREKGKPIFELRTFLMVFLALWVGLGLFFAQGDAPVEATGFIEYAKIVFIAIFTTAIVRTRGQLRVLVWVIAMCFGFYGVKNGAAGIVKGGNLFIMRGPGGMLEDNNDFALAMAMAVPLLVHIGSSETRKILRVGCHVMVPLCMLTVILTRSRGGTLSMGLMLMILVWHSRNRMIGFLIGALAVGALVALAPGEYFKRMRTLSNVEEDGSAMGRLRAWKVAGRMIDANPVFGVGFNRFTINYLDFEPDQRAQQGLSKGALVAHNSYLQIWAECGTPAFLVYVGLLVLSLIDCWRIRLEARRRYHASWIISYATMFEATLATFMLGSMFLNRAHFDLIYHYFAIVMVFGVIARRQMRDEQRYPRRRAGTVRGGPLVARSPGGFGARPAARPGFRNTPLLGH